MTNENFEPRFFSKEVCKHSNRCDYRRQGYLALGRFGEYCTGILEGTRMGRLAKEMRGRIKGYQPETGKLDETNPPKGGSGVK